MMKPFRPQDLFHDRYRLLDNLGGGELSEVWRAKDELTDKEIVVKIYVKVGEAGIRQFKNDFNLTYNLNQAYILKPDHMDVYNRRPYLLMPYFAQGSLFRRIDSTLGSVDLFSERDAATLLAQIGSALNYLHSAEIIHRDIKPDNILTGSDGRFLLTDFGISKKMRTTLVRATASTASDMDRLSFSTPYAPPEVFTLTEDPKKDIFSFGVTLFELLTGELPFGGDGGRLLNYGASIPDLPWRFSSQLNLLLRSCMHQNPVQRPSAKHLEETGQHFLHYGTWPIIDPSIETYSEIIERIEPIYQKAVADVNEQKDARRTLQHVTMLYEKALQLEPNDEFAQNRIIEAAGHIQQINQRPSKRWQLTRQTGTKTLTKTTWWTRLKYSIDGVSFAKADNKTRLGTAALVLALIVGIGILYVAMNGTTTPPPIKPASRVDRQLTATPTSKLDEPSVSTSPAAQGWPTAPLPEPLAAVPAKTKPIVLHKAAPNQTIKPSAAPPLRPTVVPAVGPAKSTLTGTEADKLDQLLTQGEKAINEDNDKMAALGYFSQARQLSSQHNLSSSRFAGLYARYREKGDVIFQAGEPEFAQRWYEVAQVLQNTSEIRQKIEECKAATKTDN